MLQRANSSPPQASKPLSAEDLAGDLIQPGHPLFGLVWINPDRMSGEPCFAGTRVPVKILFDYLEGGDSLGDFLDGFPGISRDQAIAVLEASRHALTPRVAHR